MAKLLGDQFLNARDDTFNTVELGCTVREDVYGRHMTIIANAASAVIGM